jgi:hypothetical protein
MAGGRKLEYFEKVNAGEAWNLNIEKYEVNFVLLQELESSDAIFKHSFKSKPFDAGQK